MWRVRKCHSFVIYGWPLSNSPVTRILESLLCSASISFIATEFWNKLTETRSVVTLKRGTAGVHAPAPKTGDAKTPVVTTSNSANDPRGDNAKVEEALATAEEMTNTLHRGRA
jgi:hypothetical protein